MKTPPYSFKSTLRLVAALTAFAAAVVPLRADQLINETFTGGPGMRDTAPIGGDIELGGTNAGFGWYSYAINNSALVDYTHVNGYNANNPSYGSAGIIVLGVTNSGTGNSSPCLAWTNTSTSLHDCTITNISFFTKNNSSNTTERIAVEIGGQWYATTSLFRDFTANAGSYVLNSFTFTTAAAAWQTLDTNTLSLGAVLGSPLPSGDVQSVGAYGVLGINSGTAASKIRFDNFSVTGIPAGPPRVGQPTASPADSVTAPTTVTLNVAVAGPGPLGYRWRKGGAELSDGPTGSGSSLAGSLTSQLAVSSTSPADTGNYDVVVTNSYGSRTSAVVAVTVSVLVVPPSIASITTVPANGTNEVGSTPMSISVVANGTGPFTYQWRKSNVSILNETNDTLMLASAFSNAGPYTVVVSNSVSSVTSTPPTILTVVDTTPPVLTFPGGATTNILIRTGYALPVYTATDNSGVAPVVSISGSVDTNVCGNYVLTYTATDGANNKSTNYYTVSVVLIKELFNEATADNAPVGAAPGWSAFAYSLAGGGVSNYTTMGGNNLLPTLSQAAGSLGSDGNTGYLVSGDVGSVNPCFIWLNTPEDLQSHEVTNITFSSKNNSSGNLMHIAVRVNNNWYASTATLTDNSGNAVWVGQTYAFDRAAASWQTLDVSTLTLGSVLGAPLPNYSISGLGWFCELSTGKVRIDSLVVRGTPATFITTPPLAGEVTASPLNPVDGTAWLGTPLTFQVSASGTAPLAYKWRRNGAEISGASSNPWVLSYPTSASDGSYDVVVSNSAGASTSAVVTVSVSAIGLALNEHFGESTNDPGVICQAPGWHALAINVTNATVTDFTSEPVPPWNGNFPNLARTAGADGVAGYLVTGEYATANPVLVWRDAPSGLRHGQLTNVLFYTRNTYFSGTAQVAVRIGGQWYVSTTFIQDTTLGQVPWQLHEFVFTTDAGVWQTLDTNTMSLGGITSDPLPSAAITGVGFYTDSAVTGGKDRIDEVKFGALLAEAPPTSIQPVYLDGLGNLVLRFSSSADWDYVVESAPSLQTPITWTPVATNIGTGGVITNLIPVNPAANQFFRCHLQ